MRLEAVRLNAEILRQEGYELGGSDYGYCVRVIEDDGKEILRGGPFGTVTELAEFITRVTSLVRDEDIILNPA